MRPQHLTQVAHEGNPVECFVEVLVASGGLESPNPFTGGDGDDLGGPVLYPRTGSGGRGGDGVDSGDNPANQPLLASADGDMNCQGSKSVTLTAVGGSAPYTWSTTSGVLSQDGSHIATLTPPVNSGFNYPGTAYAIYSKYEQASCTCACYGATYDCNDAFISCTPVGGNSCLAALVPGGHCSGFVGSSAPDPVFQTAFNHFCPFPVFSDGCTGVLATKQCRQDVRSADQVAHDCNPCEVTFDSAVVTVTDGTGRQAYVAVQKD